VAESVDEGLAIYDVPRAVVEPLLRSLRMYNTAADALFYDVCVLWRQLFARGVMVSTDIAAAGSPQRANLAAFRAMAEHVVNLSALTDPEGVILVVDARQAPFIERYADVGQFLQNGLTFGGASVAGAAAASASAEGAAAPSPVPVKTVCVTGVGSSALGAAAFAWNVSEALGEPAAAIVPGYGLADIIPQGLSGFFGYGLADYVRQLGDEALSWMAPQMARIGRRLSRSVPGEAARLAGEGPSYRRGSPEADILHEILLRAPQITRLYGHSKGSLCIGNAILDLPRDRAGDLQVTTFSAVIKEECDAGFEQILGNIDSLGQLNSWGNLPERWIAAWHSTNTMLPLTVPVTKLTQEGLASAPRPRTAPPPS
jgi:hypothetical protein